MAFATKRPIRIGVQVAPHWHHNLHAQLAAAVANVGVQPKPRSRRVSGRVETMLPIVPAKAVSATSIG